MDMIKNFQDLRRQDPKLLGMVLSADQWRDIIHRTEFEQKEYYRHWFDFQLYDAYKEVFNHPKFEHLREQMWNIWLDEDASQMYHGKDLHQNIEHYFDADNDRNERVYHTPAFRVARDLLIRSMHVTKLTPILVTEDMDVSCIWSRKDRSAGAIGKGSKELNEQACLEAAMQIKVLLKEGTPFEDIWIPNLLFERSQGKPEFDNDNNYIGWKYKDRAIHGEDGGTNLVEGQFARPVVAHVSRHWFNYAAGDDPETLRKKMKALTQNGLRYGESRDKEKFDQTIPPRLIRECFNIIKMFFDEEYWHELDWICFNFINSKIIVPGFGVVAEYRGIGSGSYFTSLIGSMANYLMEVTALASHAIKYGDWRNRKFHGKQDATRYATSYVEAHYGIQVGSEKIVSLMVQGDDSYLASKTPIPTSYKQKYVWDMFGVKIHPDKGSAGEYELGYYPDFLKREWRSGGEYRDPYEMVLKQLIPEHERNYENYSPWHIIYGMYLTFKYSFPSYVNELWILERVQKTKQGIEAFRDLNIKDLPGVYRSMGDKAGYWLYDHAERQLRAAS